MAEKEAEKVPPRPRKKNHGHPPHGGAWKVAFADFMTSMFALFLVLWIISSTSSSQKEAIAQYFRHPSLFTSGSSSPMDMGGNSRMKQKDGEGTGPGDKDGDQGGQQGSEKEKMQALDSALSSDSLLKSLGGQFKTKQTDQGLEIEISDAQGLGTFELGSAKVNPQMEDPLHHLSKALQSLPNKMVIAGHTDHYAYSAGGYSNWQLSSDRANAVRDRMAGDGIGAERLSAVVGYGDNELAKPNDPYAPENRRVTVLVLKEGQKYKPGQSP
jgi:chemotaxis protein MotB